MSETKAEYILDKWPRCQTCGKPWKMARRQNIPTGNTAYSYQRLLPDCDCPVAETEETT